MGRFALIAFFGIIVLAVSTGKWQLLWLNGWILMISLVWFLVVVNDTKQPYQRS